LRHRALALAAAACLVLAVAQPAPAATDASQQFLDNARERLEQGDVRAAIIQLRNALQSDPDNIDARLTLGQLYLQIGEAAAAETELRRVHKAKPGDASEVLLGQALLALGRSDELLQIVGDGAADPTLAQQKALLRAEALINVGRLDEAEQLLEQQARTGATAATANLLVARLLAARGDLAGARTAVQKALAEVVDLVPGWLLAAQIELAASQPDKAEQAARKALELSPGDLPAQLLLAEIAFRRGRLDEAEQQASALRDQAPGSVPAAYLLANIQAARGQYAEADRTLRQIADAIRTFPPGLLLSGSVKARAGQLAQAQDLLARYLALVPADRNARRLLGAVQLDAGQARAAVDTLTPLAGLQTQDAATLQLLASAQVRAGDMAGARQSFGRLAQIGQPPEAQQAQSFLGVLDQAIASPDDANSRAIILILDDLRRSRLDDALRGAETLVAASPASPDVLNLLGAVRLARGEDAPAREQFEAALAIDPSFQAALDNLDRLDIRAGQMEQVEARMRRRLEDAPGNEAAILRLAGLVARRGDPAAAERLLRAQAAALPGSVGVRLALATLYRARGDSPAMLAVADELMTIGTDGNAVAFEAAGNLYLVGQQPARAEAAFHALSERQPENVGAMLLLARAQYLAGAQDAAEATIGVVRQRAPANPIANTSMVDLRLKAGDVDGALAFAAGLAAIEPDQSAQLQARVLLAAQRGTEAVAVLEKALADRPSAAIARELYAARSKSGRQGAAIAGLREWVAANPDDAGSLNLLSQAMIQGGDYATAAAVAEQAAQLVPTNPVILNNLAWLRHELGQPGAQELARRAHQLAPNSPEITDTLGWILVRDGQVDDGLAMLREANEGTQGANPDIRYHLAYALQVSGDKEGARAILSELMATDAPFTERQAAEQLLAKLRPS
jgi:putative PEP-CTERM system TPR-repeat lipoprotein